MEAIAAGLFSDLVVTGSKDEISSPMKKGERTPMRRSNFMDAMIEKETQEGRERLRLILEKEDAEKLLEIERLRRALYHALMKKTNDWCLKEYGYLERVKPHLPSTECAAPK